MRIPKFLYEPDDRASGAAGGDGADNAENTQQPNPLEAVKQIADTFRDEIKAMRTAQPAPVAPAPNPTDPHAALRAEGAEMVKKYNEMCANGEFAEATIMMDQFKEKVAAATRGSADDDPTVKAAMSFGRRAAAKDHAAVFEKWGNEVDAIVKRMPVQERIQPDAWDKAVREVQMNHFDEVVNERIEGERKKFTPAPAAPGSRGRQQNSSPMLTEEEAFFAELCGVSPERYAFRVKEAEEYAKKPFRERGNLSDGFPLMPDGPVKPGAF